MKKENVDLLKIIQKESDERLIDRTATRLSQRTIRYLEISDENILCFALEKPFYNRGEDALCHWLKENFKGSIKKLAYEEADKHEEEEIIEKITSTVIDRLDNCSHYSI